MNVGVSYRTHKIDGSYDAIVVGSGMGGLSTAAVLARHAGKRVLVLERHYTAGGYTHSFHRPGYVWDVGVHYVGEMQDPASPVRAAFDHITEGQLQWQPMPDVYDRVVMGGRNFDFPTGIERLRGQLKRYFPADSTAIYRYLAAVKSAQRASGLYFPGNTSLQSVARLAGA